MVKIKLLQESGGAAHIDRVDQIGQTSPNAPTARAPLTEVGTRGRLLDAAMASFLEIGFTATSMDMVRQRAGVSNGSLYHHFATKQALADALYGLVLREFHAVMRLPLEGNPPTTRARTQAAVRALVRTYLDWVINSPDRARLLAECKRDDRLAGSPPEWQQANRDGFGALATFITQGAAAGHLQDFRADIWTALVLGPAIQLTPGWLALGAKTGAVQVPAPVRRTLQEAAWHAVAVPEALAGAVVGSRPRANPSDDDAAPSPQLPLFAEAAPEPVKLRTRR